jgi:hypothetical protein
VTEISAQRQPEGAGDKIAAGLFLAGEAPSLRGLGGLCGFPKHPSHIQPLTFEAV